MNTVFRCHVKNKQRLETFERALQSWKDKQLNELGHLFIVDNKSPLEADVRALAKKFGASYSLTKGDPDTKVGLYESLKAQDEFPVLCCVDDMVFGHAAKRRFELLVKNEIPLLTKPAVVGTFACYNDNTRNQCWLSGIPSLWEIPVEILYALVCHLFTKDFSEILIKRWEEVLANTKPYPACCDDIWVALLCKEFGYRCYNTMQDFAQHTGMNNRTFGDANDSYSTYMTANFVGE